MEQVRCTNCGSTAIIHDEDGEFCKCEACGSTFNVPKAAAFSKVTLDHTQDIRAWREYLAKQLRLQQESNKARDYSGVKLFAQKILSVLPDDFCGRYYAALADRYDGSDVSFTDFLENASFVGVTPDERKEVVASLVATVEPKYSDAVKEFIVRAYPDTHEKFDPILDRNIKQYIQKLRYAKVTDRDVFICHRTAEPDQDIADAICTRLEERGLRCWIAPRNILAGSQNYERDILKGVANCKVFLLVSSFKSIYSEDCEMELKAAALDGKEMYSFRIDDTPYDGAFERALAAVQWLDAQDDPYSHLEQLVIDIKGILARDEREKSELEEKRLAAREKERQESEERRRREQERLDRLERIVTSSVAASAAAPSVAPSAVSLRSKLRRADMEVQAQNYDRAQDILDEVLDIEPECAHAWWLLILCDYRMPDDKTLVESGKDFTAHRYYNNVVKYSDDEPEFVRRLDAASAAFQSRTVREVTKNLDDAEHLFHTEDYAAFLKILDKCANAFADENSIVFKRFPDVVSRYFWLRLWAKYGQTPLICVEDITRETEYKKAIEYASPAQAFEYDKARETVSRNAQMFLRERIKSKANDDKLSDYLVDNKNILPVDTYKQYSSLLYFRKMLKGLNMSEDELRNSTVDISTNEYYLLAQSVATDEQRRDYEELSRIIDANRAIKQRRECEARERAERIAKAEASAQKALSVLCAAFCGVFGGIDIVLAAVALLMLASGEAGNGVVLTLFIISGIFRILSDFFTLKTKARYAEKLCYVNLILSGIITIAIFAIGSALDCNETLVSVAAVISIVAIILESIKASRIKKSK